MARKKTPGGSGKETERRPLDRFDWDFSEVPVKELVACCHYEYARESPEICAFYDGAGKSLLQDPSYTARIEIGGETRLLTFPNPYQWPWASYWGVSFAETPWQRMKGEYRSEVAIAYTKPSFRHVANRIAFASADTPFMKRDIISRGGNRAGIDKKTGRERLAVEIDWGEFDDGQLKEAFGKWLKKNRPKGIGRPSRSKYKDIDWKAQLHRLAALRISRAGETWADSERRYPDAWKWLLERISGKPQKETEFPPIPPESLKEAYEGGWHCAEISKWSSEANDTLTRLFPHGVQK